MSAMSDFRQTVLPRILFAHHTNVTAQVDNGGTAPDAALKMNFPVQKTDEGPIRAPFIAEVQSSGKTLAGSLVFASRYMREPLADYFMYVHAYKKRQDGTFAAIAILWRRGRRGPLTDGQMAHFVEAQSFGTANLDQHSIDAYALPHGHFPGVPAASLQLVAPGGNIVVLRAELLRLLVDQTNKRVVAPQVDAAGNQSSL